MTAVQPATVEINSAQTLAWTHFAHLSDDDFDRTDTLQRWKLFRVFESARYHGIMAGIFDLNKIAFSKVSLFVLGFDSSFEQDLWKIRRGSYFPLKVSLEVVDIGQTSVTILSRLVNKLDGRELARCSCKGVHVDRATRRPTAWPDWVTKKYNLAVECKRPVKLPKAVPEVSPLAYRYEVTVAASDTDINGHTNQASYVRYCCDAAQAALKAGVLTTFHLDINRYPLKEQQALYVGESDMGDNLQVLLWQRPDQEGAIHFVIKRKSGDSQHPVIFYSLMTFSLSPVVFPRL